MRLRLGSKGGNIPQKSLLEIIPNTRFFDPDFLFFCNFLTNCGVKKVSGCGCFTILHFLVVSPLRENKERRKHRIWICFKKEFNRPFDILESIIISASFHQEINSFHATGLFQHTLTAIKKRFFDVFRGLVKEVSGMK